MSRREWKPGDVAMLSGKDDGEVRAIWQGNQWATENCRYFNDWQVAARPLVVIDPEDRQQVERLVAAVVHAQDWTPYDAGDSDAQIIASTQAALREFANPTPPKPDEPTGLGAVVEDADGVLWVRAGKELKTPDHWRATSGENLVGWWASWERINAVRVLSEGVTP